MRKLILLSIGIYIGREIYTSMARSEAQKKDKAIRLKVESYIRENHPETDPQELQREVDEIMLSKV
jgi:hypothetical protein